MTVELADVALGVSEHVGVELRAQVPDLHPQILGEGLCLDSETLDLKPEVAGDGVPPVDQEDDDPELAGHDGEHDGHGGLEDRHPSRIGTLRAHWNADGVTTGPSVQPELGHSSRSIRTSGGGGSRVHGAGYHPTPDPEQ